MGVRWRAGAAGVALGLLAGCGSPAPSGLERDAAAAVRAFVPPERPAFPSLNAQTLDWLSREVPELRGHIAAATAADQAALAELVGDLEAWRTDGAPLAVAAEGTSAAAVPAAQGPAGPGHPLDWVIGVAHAQVGAGSGFSATLAGFAGAMFLGGVAGSHTAGQTGSFNTDFAGSSGEKATMRVNVTADGTFTSSLSSSVDIPPLGAQAGSTTTFTTKGLCPSADGRVEFTIKVSRGGSAAGGAALSGTIEAHVVLTVNDNAEVATQDIKTRHQRTATGKGGTTSVSGQVDWRGNGGGDFQVVEHRPGALSGPDTEAVDTAAMVAALSMAMGAIIGAEYHWQSGNCLSIDARSPGRVDPRAVTPIPVDVISRIDAVPVSAKVTATLTGGQSLSPTSLGRTPGTLTHTAPDERRAQMTIKLVATSRRGKAEETLTLSISEGSYDIEGGAGEFRGTGLICDLAQPFTVEGSGVVVRFTPGSDRGGSYSYSGNMSGFGVAGEGTYSVQYQGEVATAIVATGPGSVRTPRGTVRGSGDEHYRLSPTHNTRC